MTAQAKKSRSIWDPAIARRATWDSFVKLNPVTLMKNPVMFVVEIGAALLTIRRGQGFVMRHHPHFRLRVSNHDVALVHGAVCQFRRSHGRRARQGAGRHAAQGAHRNGRVQTQIRRVHDRNARLQASQRRCGLGQRGAIHSRRRRSHPRRGLGGRIRHHRRVRAGHSRIGRRSLGRHRRHARPLRRNQGAHHLQSRRNVPGPHDQDGRGRLAAKDAQRDRAEHSAFGPHDHLPAGRGDAAADGHLFRRAAKSVRALVSRWCA